MFEIASRKKLRFDTIRGSLSVEDLWDLPLIAQEGRLSLDALAVNLFNQLQTQPTSMSFVNQVTSDVKDALQLKFDIVRHILDIKKKELEDRLAAKANSERKQRLLALIAQKEDQQLAETSLEDLRKLVEELPNG